MSAVNYLTNLIYHQTTSLMTPHVALSHFNPLISRWGQGNVLEAKLSGSHAKGTAVKLSADVDIFISISPNLSMSLSEIYEALFTFFNNLSGYNPRKQNVSIRVNFGNLGTVDLVPAKKQDNYTGDHSLYVRKRNTWMQTNVDEHIRMVKASGRADVIKLTKMWRERHNLDFPSLHLEMAVIRALEGHYLGDISEQFRQVLTWLGQNITTARFVDPANSNNIISDDLTLFEKSAIERKARDWQRATNWGQIVW